MFPFLKKMRESRRPFCSALVAAAGSSSRMGGLNKLLEPLDGIPVLVRTLTALQSSQRVDEIVVFRDLDKKDFAGIARLLMNELCEALAHKHISLEFDDSVLELIADMSFGKASGARDIRRVIRAKVEDEICNLLIESEDYPDSVRVCA